MVKKAVPLTIYHVCELNYCHCLAPLTLLLRGITCIRVWMSLPCIDIRVDAGTLSSEQAGFWGWFYRHTFAEFGVVNGLPESSIQVTVNGVAAAVEPPARAASRCGGQGAEESGPKRGPRVLCPLDGGKDSLVAFSLLAAQFQALPTPDGEEDVRGRLTWLFVSDNIDRVSISACAAHRELSHAG